MASQEDERQSSTADLFGSLKIVSDAAQSTFNKQTDKVNTGEVAGAASNLLGAASQYGNLDDQRGFGKYVDQAQGYLQKYHQSSQSGHSPLAATDKPTRTESPVDETESEGPEAAADDGSYELKRPDAAAADDEGAEPRKAATDEADTEPKRKDEQEEGGGFGSAEVGDYVKVAQGLLGKSAGEDDAETKGNKEEGGDGVRDYMKLAQGFLGKSANEDEEEAKGNKKGGGAGVGDYVNIAKGFFGK